MKNNIKSGNWFENRSEIERMHNSLGFNYESSSVVIADQATTDTERFNRLKSAYEKAKLLTPGGNALSSTNRAVVLIPPGTYHAGTDSLTLDANYVDLIAMCPQKGQIPNDSFTVVSGKIIGEAYNPTNTNITGTGLYVVTQAVDNVRLIGFGISNVDFDNEDRDKLAFRVTDTSGGANSYYEKMTFFAARYYSQTSETLSVPPDTHNPMFAQHVDGIWIDCVAVQDFAWRVRYTQDFDSIFRAKMRNCWAAFRSYGGDDYRGTDVLPGSPYEHKFSGCILENCVATTESFGGCSDWGLSSDSTAYFIECESGDKSFSFGGDCGGNYIRCRGGLASFGGTTSIQLPAYEGSFTGYAEDCVGGDFSFGGSHPLTYSFGFYGKLTGTLFRCKIEKNETFGIAPIHCEGAEIRNCYINGGLGDGTGYPTLILEDDNTIITDSTILNVEGDTAGAPIGAATAKNVIAVNNTFNNGSTFATGLNANVTNIATTPNNGVY